MAVASQRVQAIGAYAFAEVDRQVERLKSEGIVPTDFGVGDPLSPTPGFIRAALKAGADKHRSAGYPSYIGSLEFRQAVADWTRRRHGVELDPATEVSSSVGSKEAIFHFPLGVVNPGDVAIIPSPGYPPYSRGTLFAGGDSYFVPLTADNGFLMDLEAVPAEVRERARVLWVNTPNSPTGRVVPREVLQATVEWCRRHDIICCSDEAYSEIYFTDEAPATALEFGREGIIVFQSLSKRSAMTGYRIGWVAGDPELVAIYRKVKTNLDSGTPNFVQEAGIAALDDEEHVVTMRNEYRHKRDLMVEALASLGLAPPDCEGTFYLWQRVPDGWTSVELATALLRPDLAMVTTPGSWISTPTASGENPGEGYIRFALVPTVEETVQAAERLKAIGSVESLQARN